MTDAFLSINSIRANTAVMHAPFSGRWMVDVDYDGTLVPSGAATIQIGSLSLVGTIVPDRTGLFLGHVRACVVAGANGWPKVVSAKSYHDDGGVRRSSVLAGLASETGETIDTAGDNTRMAIDFERIAEPASRTLQGALGGIPWRVDYDGVTRYGDRPTASLGAGAELLEFDPRTRVMTFGALDPSSVPIGAVVSDVRMGAPITIREIDVEVKSGALRIYAWGRAS